MKSARRTRLPKKFRPLWALSELKEGDIGRLLPDLRRFLKSNPRCLNGWMVLATHLAFVRKSEAEQLECWCRALVLDPSNYEAHMEVASLTAKKLPLPVLRFHLEVALAGCPDTFEEAWLFSRVNGLSKERIGLRDLAAQARRREKAIMAREP